MVECFQIKGGNTPSGQPKDRHSDVLSQVETGEISLDSY